MNDEEIHKYEKENHDFDDLHPSNAVEERAIELIKSSQAVRMAMEKKWEQMKAKGASDADAAEASGQVAMMMAAASLYGNKFQS